MRRLATASLVLLALAALAAVTAAQDGHEASSILGCRAWIKTQRQMADGLMTMPELRGEVKALYENYGSVATPPVRDASRSLLRGLTVGTDADRARAVRELNAACMEIIKRFPSRF